ncbi:MAG: two-component regulator propeller domain-containing protein [Myxococcota bacterium]
MDEDLVFLVKADRRGRLWVGSAAGLVMQQDGRWTSFHQDHGLPHPLVRAMVEDRQGQLWVGTQQGAAVFDEASGRFRPLEKLDQDPTAVISLNIASDGSVWMGTETGVVSWREGGDVRTFTTADGLPNDVVRAVYEDQKKRLWFGTLEGLVRWSDGEMRVFGTADGLPSDTVRAVEEDEVGNLWVATNGGLGRLPLTASKL